MYLRVNITLTTRPRKPSSSSELQLRQPGVHAALLDQISMAAFFNHPALVKHHDEVC
jgi:hypothetical protein